MSRIKMEIKMAFDGLQSQAPFGKSLFPPFTRQASCGGVLPLSMPCVSLHEQDPASYSLWCQNGHDDPYGLYNGTESGTKSRRPTDNTYYDGETDLQGLVSNILDEEDSPDSYFSEGSLPIFNSVWSPNTLREELLQDFQSEVKTHPTFPPNHVACNDLSNGQGQSEHMHVKDFYQQPNGLVSSHNCPFSLPNGDGNSHAVRPQKLPPGLPVPNTGNAYLSQMPQSNYDSMSADKYRANGQLLKNFPAISDVFRPQGTMNSSCFHPRNEDHHIQSSAEPISEQYVPQDINQLLRSFQSIMAGEHRTSRFGDCPNMHRQSVALDQDDSMADHGNHSSPALSTQRAPAMQTPKQLMGKMGTVQMRSHGGVGNQVFQDRSEFSPQSTEYFQHPMSTSGSFNLPNHYRNTMTTHRENGSHPSTTSMNQYPQHQVQRGQRQSRFPPQTQNEERGMNMPGYVGEVSTRHRKQSPSQSIDGHSRSTQCRKFDVGNGIINGGNTQQYMPARHLGSDPRKNASVPVNYSSFSSRSTLPNGSYVSGKDTGDKMSANGSAASKHSVCGMMTRPGENPYHGIVSDMRPPTSINEGRPAIQIYLNLNECNVQWSYLEKERKRTVAVLNRTFPGKRAAAVTQTNLLKTPRNLNGVDHLIAKHTREQGKVEGLVKRMELLNTAPLQVSIYTALDTHHTAISAVQFIWLGHKEGDMSKPQRSHLAGDKETPPLVDALKDLAASTRSLRTALWHGLQMTLPRPDKRQDHHVNGEDAASERCPSPFEGYTFKF